MQYRKFGKLDWQASALGFGCMRLPTLGGDAGNIDQDKTNEMIRWAIDRGLNYVDTAYVYHNQQSEVALGKALQDGYRERVRIATKLPIWLVKATDDFDRMLNEELKRLQTDHIDFYLMHSLDKGSWEKVQKLGLLKKAEAAIRDGRIRHVGFSFHDNLDVFKRIVDGYDAWTFCQIQYNYMDIHFQAGSEGLHYAADKGLAVVIMEPLRGGRLAADLPAANPIWAQAEQKRKPADWALQWLWSQPEVSLVLSGMSTLEQVQENVASADNSRIGLLNAEELMLVDKVRQTLTGLSPIDCTRCEYCLPCPNGVNIPRVFDYYNRVAMYYDLENTRTQYQKMMEAGQKAANCIQCGECLPKCPQSIPISDWMPVIDEVLENNQPYQNTL
jgi:predicted aldo/keto reductase-like oxidoreductase